MTPRSRGMQGEDPFSRRLQRESAEASFVPPPEPHDDEDQQVRATSDGDSNSDIKADSMSDSGAADRDGTPATGPRKGGMPVAPAPPATAKIERTNTFVRMRTDRKQALETYRQEHRVTLQAVLDQAIDEYLDRRGILPPD